MTALDRLTSVFFFNVLFNHIPTMETNYTNYASFNVLTITGRISHSEIRSGKYGDFLSVTVLSTLVRDGAETAIIFTDNAGLLKLAAAGHLDAGRQVTLTGRVTEISEVYTDNEGLLQMRKRPQMTMGQVNILDGGLGPKPASQANKTTVSRTVVRPSDATRQARRPEQEVAVDATPDLCDVAPY